MSGNMIQEPEYSMREAHDGEEEDGDGDEKEEKSATAVARQT